MFRVYQGHINSKYLTMITTALSLILMDPCIVDDSVEISTRCSFVIEFIIRKFIERSTSGALNCVCSLWFIYTYGDQSLPLSLGDGRSPHVYINQRLQMQFRAPDDERYAARNMLNLQ